MTTIQPEDVGIPVCYREASVLMTISRELFKRYIAFLSGQLDDIYWDHSDYELPCLLPDTTDGSFTKDEVEVINGLIDEVDLETEEKGKAQREQNRKLAEISFRKTAIGFGMSLIREADGFRFNLHCGTTIPYAITPPVLSLTASGQFPRISEAQCPWDFVDGVGRDKPNGGGGA